MGVIRDTEAKIGEELERLGRVVREERGAGEEQLKERTKYRKKLAEVVGECSERAGPGEWDSWGLHRLGVLLCPFSSSPVRWPSRSIPPSHSPRPLLACQDARALHL